jgi:hypothetical protein
MGTLYYGDNLDILKRHLILVCDAICGKQLESA